MEPVGRYHFPLDFFKRSIPNQNLVRRMVFGAERYSAREDAMGFLILRYKESPEFFTIPFLAAIWGRMTVEYVRNATEGVRRLTQLGIKSDGLKELKRLARHSQGWQLPLTFCVESSKGYRRRYVFPRIDLETGRAEYRGAIPKSLASSGVTSGARGGQPSRWRSSETEGIMSKGEGR